jgi:hypothetical protein
MLKHTLLFAIIACVLGCSANRRLPKGPPPEYERARVLPWDAGAPRGDDLDELIDEAMLPQSPESSASESNTSEPTSESSGDAGAVP